MLGDFEERIFKNFQPEKICGYDRMFHYCDVSSPIY